MTKHSIRLCGPRLLFGWAALLSLLAGCGGPAQSHESPQLSQQVAPLAEPAGAAQPSRAQAPTSETQGSTDGVTAMRQAAEADKYLFAFFWKTEDAQTTAMRAVFEQAVNKAADRADGVTVNITDPAEKEIVDKFGLERAPMPLVLAIAPNGAITGGFPSELREEALLEAFATPCTEQCMKCLQDGKLVFLCVQNGSTTLNEEAMQGVRDFKADDRFAEATEIVRLDPSDAAEADFLADLQVRPDTKTAVTVFLAPPGMPVAMYEGATNKEELVKTLMTASSSCCPGGSCGPGGCGPKK